LVTDTRRKEEMVVLLFFKVTSLACTTLHTVPKAAKKHRRPPENTAFN
jgi:hypothetical protein